MAHLLFNYVSVSSVSSSIHVHNKFVMHFLLRRLIQFYFAVLKILGYIM